MCQSISVHAVQRPRPYNNSVRTIMIHYTFDDRPHVPSGPRAPPMRLRRHQYGSSNIEHPISRHFINRRNRTISVPKLSYV